LSKRRREAIFTQLQGAASASRHVLIAAAGSRGPQTFVASDRMARFDVDSSRPECANTGHSPAAWWMGQIGTITDIRR
jgi:hypothetical protein